MPDIPTLLIVIIALALVFDYTNGGHGSANAISTVVSTKVMSPRQAVVMATVRSEDTRLNSSHSRASRMPSSA